MRRVNESGIIKYITPFKVVPTVAIEPGEDVRKGDEGEVV